MGLLKKLFDTHSPGAAKQKQTMTTVDDVVALQPVVEAAKMKPGTDAVLVTLLSAQLGALGERAPSWRAGGLHASEMARVCVRQQLFTEFTKNLPDGHKKKLGPMERTIDEKLMRIFAIGHATHKFWQEQFFGPMGVLIGGWRCTRCRYVHRGTMPRDVCPTCKWTEGSGSTVVCADTCRWKGGYTEQARDCRLCARWGAWEYVEPHVSLTDFPEFVGHVDGILDLRSLGVDFYGLLEIKTVNSTKWKSMTEMPYHEYTLQANYYMHCSGMAQTLFVFLDKNDWTYKVMVVDYDPLMADKLIRDIQHIHQRRKDRTMPESGPCNTPTAWRAKECPFAEVCFAKKADGTGILNEADFQAWVAAR